MVLCIDLRRKLSFIENVYWLNSIAKILSIYIQSLSVAKVLERQWFNWNHGTMKIVWNWNTFVEIKISEEQK